MKIIKGKIRIMHKGVDIEDVMTRRSYDEHGNITVTNEVRLLPSTPKIDELRKATFDKVMKKLNKKNITITGTDADDKYTTIYYEVRS